MEIRNINSLPQLIASGELTKEEGVNALAEFICSNYPVFGLHKFDEDFRSEIFLSVLEKGEKLLSLYKPESGDFFTFLFCFIKSQVKSELKTRARTILNERLSLQQSIENYESYIANYEKSSQIINYQKAPYAYKKPKLEDLQAGIKQHKLENCDKALLVLAVKSSYYITDEQIKAISKLYGIDTDLFYDIIQYFREEIFPKKERLNLKVERRNFAYYLHKKYTEQIKIIENQEQDCYTLKKLELKKRDNFQLHHLNSLNEKFDEGYLYLRPSTKLIADVFGICDRQINYYLNCIRHGKIDANMLSKLQNLTEDDIVS